MKHEQQYQQLFSRLAQFEPRTDLELSIMTKVYKIQKSRARLRAGMHASLVFGALIGFIPALKLLITSAGQSGFFEYISLGFSDGTAVLGIWKSFIFSMIESAPTLETGLVLGLGILCAYSLRQGARYASMLFGAPKASLAS